MTVSVEGHLYGRVAKDVTNGGDRRLQLDQQRGTRMPEAVKRYSVKPENFCGGDEDGLAEPVVVENASLRPKEHPIILLLCRKKPRLLLNAVGIAASFSSGNFTFLHEGASVKAAQPGIAAQGAISAIQLARGGVTGATGVFEGAGGFFGLYARDETASERFSASLASMGSEWLITDSAFKEFPCCHYIHPFIEAVGRGKLDISSPEDIAGIRCRVPVGQEAIIAIPWERKQSPMRANEARWSLPYVVALRVVTGGVSIENFEGTPNPDVVALAKRITWEPWSDSGYPERFPAEIQITLRDGSSESIVVADVNGNRTRPWGIQQVVSKFTKNAELGGLSDQNRDRILEAFLQTANPDITVLNNLVTP